MIYLIESAAFKEVEGNFEFFFILKIGYTGDDEKTFKSRFAAYKLHNPTVEILYTIPGLTTIEEDKIQKRFKEYMFPNYGVEWFYYKDEILDFFKTMSEMGKKESEDFIRELIVESSKTTEGSSLDLEERRFVFENRPKIKLVLARILSSSECSRVPEINSVLINSYENGYKDFQGLLEYIRKVYGEEVIKEYEERMKVLELNPENKRVVEDYHKASTIMEKLKVLYKNEINDIILSNIPDSDELKSIYKVVGPERIMATGYNITDLRREFSVLTFRDVDMYAEVYVEFKVGNRYQNSIIKEKLSIIYSKYNFLATPKAVDLFNFFELKGVNLSIEDPNNPGKKKRAQGYEILGYKEDSKAYIAYMNYLENKNNI